MTNLNTTTSVKIKKIRVGRGIGSGKGKTSGRGVKGQKSRSGVAIKSFEGGQMPLYRRLPKRGFNPIRRDKIAKINLDILSKLLDSNKISSSEKINLEYLKKNKIISKSVTQFKVLGNGELNSKLNIEADFSSKSAIQKVEKAGGSILVKSNKD